ncbi:uncharacterized protein (DUF58 family) [Catenibacillus scindens]|uniref:Uncharacterized protein (DUF58 family) n=1 Tax=Catenibacillus scindens TaxID=673271 RepID=A0A7W8M3I3_9FIRM|nr:DUF58 domain-containing protein [Catenibacillus scindens]MBB5263080.1 uncharacterized protein (DUF58 family) [Catenibacillus scindens]
MNIIFAAFGLFILYMIQKKLYQRNWNKNLNVTMAYSKETAVEGEEAALVEVLVNDKKLPLPALTVKFQTSSRLSFLNSENSSVTDLYYRSDIFSFNGREKITRTLPFTCTRRGYYTITQMALSCTDLLYIEKLTEIRDNFTQLYVYPRYVDIRRLLIPFNQLYGAILSKRRYFEDPFEFRGMREYQPFDSMRRVNWKAFARTGELKVNVYEDTSSQEVCIYLNLENNGYVNHYDIMEENIRLGATLSDMFISKGIPVSLKTNGCDCTSKLPIQVDAGTGAGHQTRLLQSLARIDLELPVRHLSEQIQKDLELGGQIPYIIYITNYCHDDMIKAVNAMARANDSFQMIYTYHRDMQDSFQVSPEILNKTMFWEVEHID